MYWPFSCGKAITGAVMAILFYLAQTLFPRYCCGYCLPWQLCCHLPDCFVFHVLFSIHLWVCPIGRQVLDFITIAWNCRAWCSWSQTASSITWLSICPFYLTFFRFRWYVITFALVYRSEPELDLWRLAVSALDCFKASKVFIAIMQTCRTLPHHGET